MSKTKATSTKLPSAMSPSNTPALLADLRQLIEQARHTALMAVNASLTLMYWHIGQRIHKEVLGGQRASYGTEIVATLSRQLATGYGRGFNEKNLRRMELDKSGIHVAEYLTVLPPREVFQQKIHEAMVQVRLRIQQKELDPS